MRDVEDDDRPAEGQWHMRILLILVGLLIVAMVIGALFLDPDAALLD